MKKLNFGSSDQILRTKLAPNLPDGLVERLELLNRLDRCLKNYRLSVLSAPAGFGKTTLAAQWFHYNSFQSEGRRVGWLTLDAGDNNLASFWRYFMLTCQRIWPEADFIALEMLLDGQPMPQVLTVLINELALVDGGGVLVLEDFHLIKTPDVYKTLTFLIDHLPAQLRVLLLTQPTPALPLSRWRTSGELAVMTADELRFSPKDTQNYLTQNLDFAIAPEVAHRLQTRTGGWPTGISLAVRGVQGQTAGEAEKFLAALTGDYPPIRDFILNEILEGQSETARSFLLKTCFLARLNPALAEAVTGMGSCALLLEELAATGMFLARPDTGDNWYTYQEFFVGAGRFEARRRMGESVLRGLAAKASQWYEQNGLLEEAVETALQAGDFERAGDLLEKFTLPACNNFNIYRVRHWFETLPQKVWQARPALCFNYAVVLLFTSDRAQPATRLMVETPLQMAERVWLVEENWPSLGALMAFRSCLVWFQGDYRPNLVYLTHALEWLPQDETFWRGVALCNMVPHELYEGRLNRAIVLLREAVRLNVLSNNQYSKRANLFMLAEIYRHQLELDQAVQLYNQVIEEAADDFSDRSQAFFNLAQICFDRHELEAAARYLEQAMETNPEADNFLLQIKATLLLVRLKNVQGETTQAEKLLQMLVARSQNWPLLRREVEACQAQFAIARGELRTARFWSAMLASLPAEGPRLLLEREGLVQARLLLAQKNYAHAHALLAKWLVEAQEQGRAASECEIWLLKARTYFGEGDRTQAALALHQALSLAQPENFFQIFIEEGKDLASLLQAVLPTLTDPAMLEFGRSLLGLGEKALPEAARVLRQPAPALAPARLMTLPEPLSRQEQRVLRLLSEGLSNSEIAGELVVSINTVKSQVKSIYRKLDVTSRREARQFAGQTLPA